MKYWKRDEKYKGLTYDIVSQEQDKISVTITEGWSSDMVGHLLIDFVIKTERGEIKECIFIPALAFKELIKLQRKGKVTKNGPER